MSENKNILSLQEISRKGQEIYDELKEGLESKYKGKYIAIEIESKHYEIGDTPLEAIDNAEKKYPNKLFHLIRIGFPGLYTVSRTAKKEKHGWLY